MLAFFANIFGYLLNFLYNLINNYGLAIILFSVIIKLIMLPLSIKQQKSLKKNAKIQEQLKTIQFKYKNDPERLNQETINLYKSEKMSPFSGCLSAIIQLILLLSIFYLVKQPLTYMRKMDPDVINGYVQEITEQGKLTSNVYPEIDVIREKGSQDENVNINMNFFGLDLSKVPNQNLSDITVYIIPALYVLSSFVSMRITTAMQTKKNKKELTDGKTGEIIENEEDPMAQTNKMMSWMMPIMSVSIAIIAPLGLALYWLVNNILMICERLILNKIIDSKEELTDGQ